MQPSGIPGGLLWLENTVVEFFLRKNDLYNSHGQTQEQNQNRKKSVIKHGNQAGGRHGRRHGEHGLAESLAIGSFVLDLGLVVIVDQVGVPPVNGATQKEKQNGNFPL